ncbi:uncharacterized protein LOC121801833 isoform X1 [Salvia splendens]|uniref:uncharacterized protein LOC121801833 isoform X1 n=1 Tax=Salvia splendens TaxID=180675 RepID=UPI001C254483|nr:uncharacterized protein LOC121801833 isoform X1 [Salvia splendens]XP_042057205.1 uncharacterized protein LOC121801833 isoform X1 [Salvia splendens]XP_042057213.1 uncharacterized protein LOC121801833 isoform X1 [Salvia splendens]
MPPPEFPSPPPSHSPTLQRYGSGIHRDHVLNMSPKPSQHPNSVTGLAHLGKTSNSSGSDTTSKPSAELVQEIATLEVEISRLEHHLLSLYRTAFQQHLPRITEDQVETPRGGGRLNQPSQKDRQCENSPTSSLAGPHDLAQVSFQKSSSYAGRLQEKQRAYSQQRSLADHIGNSRIDDALTCPARLSEDIIRCISSIYCKLANPTATEKGCSVSSTSSFGSSTTFSPRNLSGSWSPQCNEEVTQSCDFEQENGPYAGMVEVLKLCVDDETYKHADVMLQRFRSLVKSLEIVEPMKMRREEKLAFWINIHNALVMHAYLAYGTQQYLKSSSIAKAAYNVGGHCVNAYDIQSSILGITSHYSSPASLLQTLVSPKKLKGGKSGHAFAIEYPEPLVHFTVSSGAYSDPAVRIYRANSVFEDMKVAKEEFIQANVYVHKETKVYLPKILCYYAKDMSMTTAALVEVVSECLPGIQQKSVRACVKGRPEKYMNWLEQSSSFRFLIHKEL